MQVGVIRLHLPSQIYVELILPFLPVYESNDRKDPPQKFLSWHFGDTPCAVLSSITHMNYLLFIINIISHKKFAISNTICLAVYLISNIFYMSHQNNSDIYSFQTLQINFAILRIHQLSNHLILNITTQELPPNSHSLQGLWLVWLVACDLLATFTCLMDIKIGLSRPNYLVWIARKV